MLLLSSLAAHANELNKSDANIIGHVLDESTKEHLSLSVYRWKELP